MAIVPMQFNRLESTYHLPAIAPTPASIEDHFRSSKSDELAEIKDPHHFTGQAVNRQSLREAAVLIPIIARDLTLLLTTRPAHMRAHPGQNCFPGGSLDSEHEEPLQAALRETWEEIGLHASQIRIVGRLGKFCTTTGFRITPFVGIVEGEYQLTVAEAEVEEVVYLPLHHIMDSGSYERRQPKGSDDSWYYCTTFDGHYVGGPTVAIMMGFYEELLKSHR
jgi:8-oxo-dGTP pyrophosphatase MutT (NUDIX family)